VEPFLQNALIVTVGTLLGVPLALLTLLRREDERLLDLGLGFTGGVMLVASFTSLILPGVEGVLAGGAGHPGRSCAYPATRPLYAA
jgi:ZIP family zinc transporter